MQERKALSEVTIVARLASQSSGLKKCWHVCPEATANVDEGRILITLGREWQGLPVSPCVEQAFRSCLGGFEATWTFSESLVSMDTCNIHWDTTNYNFWLCRKGWVD